MKNKSLILVLTLLFICSIIANARKNTGFGGRRNGLLIDSWKDQSAIDEHHASPMMRTIAELRDKYDLHMTVERYLSDDENADIDSEFIRK